MTKVWIGGYVSFDAEKQSDELLPLLECLRYASELGFPIDEYLKHVFGEYGPAGGGPGWSIDWIDKAEDALFPEDWKRCMAQLPAEESGCFEAWTEQDISLLDPPYAYYPKETVRHYVREVLNNVRERCPERALEVDAALDRLGLKDVQ